MSDKQQIQRQAQALGDPSRFEIFEHIASSPGPVGVAELTDLMGFNHNAIRQHLAKLLDAGLVTETAEKRQTRGRPRLTYRARGDAFDRFQNRSGGSYRRLAGLLLDLVVSGDTPHEVGRRSAGCEGFADPAPAAPTQAEIATALATRLEADGFDPSTNGVRIELNRCPFADLAGADPSIVCELHRGLIDGCVEELSTTTRATLTPRPPEQAGCVVDIKALD